MGPDFYAEATGRYFYMYKLRINIFLTPFGVGNGNVMLENWCGSNSPYLMKYSIAKDSRIVVPGGGGHSCVGSNGYVRLIGNIFFSIL